MFKSNLNGKTLIKYSLLCGALLMVLFIAWVTHLSSQIKTSLKEGWFLPPLEIYSAPKTIYLNGQFSNKDLLSYLHRNNFRERNFEQPLLEGD
jgi:hypothetical protein